jgi:ketosteroid isomerase-like protein
MKRFALLVVLPLIAVLAAPVRSADNDSDKDQVADTLKKYEETWINAAKKKDAGPLEKMLADDWTFTNPMGQVSGKSELVDAVKDGTFAPESAEYDDLKVRVYGDAAVVTGRLDLKAKWGDTDISAEYRFTDTFVKKDGKWQEVAGQTTRIGNG